MEQRFLSREAENLPFGAAVKKLVKLLQHTGPAKFNLKLILSAFLHNDPELCEKLLLALSRIPKLHSTAEYFIKLCKSKQISLRSQIIDDLDARLVPKFAQSIGYELNDQQFGHVASRLVTHGKSQEVLALADRLGRREQLLTGFGFMDMLVASRKVRQAVALAKGNTEASETLLNLINLRQFSREACELIDASANTIQFASYPALKTALLTNAARFHAGQPNAAQMIAVFAVDQEALGLLCFELQYLTYRKPDRFRDRVGLAAFILDKYPFVSKYLSATARKTIENTAPVCPKFPTKFGPFTSGCEALAVPHTLIATKEALSCIKLSAVVGVDSEWRPTLHKYDQSRIAVFQLATETHVYVIDMLALGRSVVPWLTQLFTNKDITKVGIGFQSDIEQLARTYPQLPPAAEFQGVFDISDYDRRGLQKLCAEILGKSICKQEQMSMWELRPLRPTQIHYAAMDAVMSLALYPHFKNAIPLSQQFLTN